MYLDYFHTQSVFDPCNGSMEGEIKLKKNTVLIFDYVNTYFISFKVCVASEKSNFIYIYIYK